MSAGAVQAGDTSGRPAGRFFVAAGALYLLLVCALTLTISPYFSLGWDVKTFIAAGRSFFDVAHGPFSLYQESRAVFYWPYAYPPLHALLVAPFLLAQSALPFLPESVLVRLPVALFDLALAWLLAHGVTRASARPEVGRLAALLWLFNPVTLYHTAVQAHFESEWVLLVLLAYACGTGLSGARAARPAGALGAGAPPRSLGDSQPQGGSSHSTGAYSRVLVPSLLLAAAILVKQIAVLYALPYWLWLWLAGRRREALGSGAVVAVVVGLVCLPFALHSGDFSYMVTTYVAQMPVQTQSGLVWILLLKEYLTSPVTSSFVLITYALPIVALLAALVSAWGLREAGRAAPRDGDAFGGLCRVGLLVTLVFFLFSPKVMAYYYAILIPFLLLVLLPRERYGLLALCFGVLSWILLSPYYASWAQPAHLWLYGVLGTLNSLFFVWLFAQAWQEPARQSDVGGSAAGGRWWRRLPRAGSPGALAAAVAGLSLAFVLPVLVQPVHVVPIIAGRQDLSELLAALVLLFAALVLTLPVVSLLRRVVGAAPLRWALLSAALYFPFTFMQFYVTRESTRVLELLWP